MEENKKDYIVETLRRNAKKKMDADVEALFNHIDAFFKIRPNMHVSGGWFKYREAINTQLIADKPEFLKNYEAAEVRELMSKLEGLKYIFEGMDGYSG